MHVRNLFAIATFTIATAALAADGNFERTLSVSGSPNVSVATGSGYIHLKPGSDNQVHVIGRVHAGHGWMSGDADSRVQQIINNPPITQNGNDITIGKTHDNDLFRNVSIDYDVTLPRASNISRKHGTNSASHTYPKPKTEANSCTSETYLR